MKISDNNQRFQPLPDKKLQESFRYSMFICTGEMLNKLFPKKEESEEQHEDEV